MSFLKQSFAVASLVGILGGCASAPPAQPEYVTDNAIRFVPTGVLEDCRRDNETPFVILKNAMRVYVIYRVPSIEECKQVAAQARQAQHFGKAMYANGTRENGVYFYADGVRKE